MIDLIYPYIPRVSRTTTKIINIKENTARASSIVRRREAKRLARLAGCLPGPEYLATIIAVEYNFLGFLGRRPHARKFFEAIASADRTWVIKTNPVSEYEKQPPYCPQGQSPRFHTLPSLTRLKLSREASKSAPRC